MNNDLVTIIIPIYKVEKYLSRCIESVLEQTYKNLQIILVDDGSPDNCGKICDEYAKKDNRIQVIHKENGGLSDARNKGLEIAKGKYIYLLDSDDYLEINTIQYLHSLAEEYQADIIVGKERLVFENCKCNNYKCEKEEVEIYNEKEALEIMLYNTKFTNMGCNKLYKTNLFEGIKYPFGKLYEDLGTTYKLIVKSEKIVLTNQYTYNYLIDRNDSIMNKKFNEKRMDGLEFAEEILQYINKSYPSLTDAAIFRLYIECVYILLKLPNKKIYKEQNDKIKKYLRKYRWNVLKNKKVSKKQKILCISANFGRFFLRMIWKVKEIIKCNQLPKRS